MKTIILAIVFANLIVTLTGCKTPPATIAIRSEGAIITSVDVGMKSWSIYANSGKATQQQIDTVKQAYITYYNAQLIAEAALEKYISTGSTNAADISSTSQAVTTGQTALLALLNQYIK